MMQQAKTCPINAEADAGRLSVVLRNPSAEWSDIRAAMKSKAQGRACTNLAVVTSLASAGTGSSRTEKDTTVAVKDEQTVAKEEATDAAVSSVDRLMPLGDRRASLSSQDSSKNNLTSRRGITRQTSRRRTMRRQGSLRNSRRLLLRSSVNASMKSITLESLDESSSNFNNSSSDFKNSSIEFNNSSSFKDSINIMDFGISQQLGVRAALAQDGNHQSCLSLDESALEDLREEYDRSKRGLLMSWRHDSRISDLDGSTRSEGDLDGFVDSCGFMAWPAAKEGEEESVSDNGAIGTAVEDNNTHTFIEEETTDEVQQHVEEWNISDYEVGDDSDQCRTRKNSMSMAMAKTIERFSMPKRFSSFSRTSSTLSQKDDDLMKIKETLPTLLAKNKLQQSGEAEATIGKKKREGPMSLIQAKKAADGPTGRKSDELIWAKDDSCNSLGFDYKTLYAQTPKKAQQRKSWNIFEGVKGNVCERRSSD